MVSKQRNYSYNKSTATNNRKPEMTVTIVNAYIASINNASEVAYHVEYSEGTKIRVVVSAGGWIRNEYLKDGEWLLTGKAYIVNKDKKRQGERIIEKVKEFISK